MEKIGDYFYFTGVFLGKGGYAHVFKGKHQGTGMEVAVKICKYKDHNLKFER